MIFFPLVNSKVPVGNYQGRISLSHVIVTWVTLWLVLLSISWFNTNKTSSATQNNLFVFVCFTRWCNGAFKSPYVFILQLTAVLFLVLTCANFLHIFMSSSQNGWFGILLESLNEFWTCTTVLVHLSMLPSQISHSFPKTSIEKHCHKNCDRAKFQ